MQTDATQIVFLREGFDSLKKLFCDSTVTIGFRNAQMRNHDTPFGNSECAIASKLGFVR